MGWVLLRIMGNAVFCSAGLEKCRNSASATIWIYGCGYEHLPDLLFAVLGKAEIYPLYFVGHTRLESEFGFVTHCSAEDCRSRASSTSIRREVRDIGLCGFGHFVDYLNWQFIEPFQA